MFTLNELASSQVKAQLNNHLLAKLTGFKSAFLSETKLCSCHNTTPGISVCMQVKNVNNALTGFTVNVNVNVKVKNS